MDGEVMPWSYPAIFIKILLNTESYQTIMNCRGVCKSWRNWFNRNTIWQQFLKHRKKHLFQHPAFVAENSGDFLNIRTFTKYRLERLIHDSEVKKLSETEALTLSCRIERCIRQLELRLVPFIIKRTYRHTMELKKKLNEKEGIKSLGPMSTFIRIKVNNELVSTIVTEVLSKHLSSIVVDKVEKTNEGLQRQVMRGMPEGQNWIFTYFKPQAVADIMRGAPKAVVYASEAEMLAAMRAEAVKEAEAAKDAEASSVSNGTPAKRGREGDNEEEASKKKMKVDRSDKDVDKSDNGVDKDVDKSDNDEEDEDEDENEDEKNIYSDGITEFVNPYYPTLLELLDIDHPVLKKELISKFSIDKTLVVPRLDEILLQQSTCSDIIPKGFEVVGRDQDGNLSKINPEVDVHVSDQAVVRFIENIVNLEDYDDTVMFWGGNDIRDRWSMFSEQLRQAEKQNISITTKNNGFLGQLPRMSTTSQNRTIPKSLPDLQVFLHARGITLERR